MASCQAWHSALQMPDSGKWFPSALRWWRSAYNPIPDILLCGTDPVSYTHLGESGLDLTPWLKVIPDTALVMPEIPNRDRNEKFGQFEYQARTLEECKRCLLYTSASLPVERQSIKCIFE